VSVTAPQGFRASGVAAGLKPSGKPDVAIVVNDGPSDVAAAVFTANRCKANPVLWSEQVIADGRARAVVLNSGGANCYTGPEGFQNTHASAELTADLLDVSAGDVVVCSTGLIGEQLDGPKLMAGIEQAAGALSNHGGPDAAAAIMTTDSVPKQSVHTGTGWTLGGMAKGAGMLAPELATFLCVLSTDAVLDQPTADSALRHACRRTFDRLDSDGCMSTNDTVLLLASGASALTPPPEELRAGLAAVCHDLAMQLLADAEGATKEVTIEVTGAATETDAVQVGRSVARSNLVKCALFGNDPNWGRIASAVGTTSAAFEPDGFDIAVNGVVLCRAGAAAAGRSGVDLTGRTVHIGIDLHAGPATATVWTNDLSTGYVHENSAYSS
jgi:glutamate N-acetyltransferase / amino-acid N-acetyltransferase